MKTEKLFKNIKKKIKKNIEESTNKIAKEFFNDLKKKSVDESYSDELVLSKYKDKIFIHVDSKEKPISNEDLVVFYYEPLSKRISTSQLNFILDKYAPYPKRYIPYKFSPKEFRLVFRKITEKEYENVIKRFVDGDLNKVINELQQNKIPSSLLSPQEEREELILAYEDLLFSVLRKEKGIRVEKKSIWTECIEKFKSGEYINGSNTSMIKEDSEDLSDDLNRFQKEILR